jgi:putative transposase
LLFRSVYLKFNARSVRARDDAVLRILEERFPKAADLLAQAREELLAFTSFPREHWQQIWSSDPQERLNNEIRHQSGVDDILPNHDAILRLAVALSAEQPAPLTAT